MAPGNPIVKFVYQQYGLLLGCADGAPKLDEAAQRNQVWQPVSLKLISANWLVMGA
jgi:hypothetical protein